MTPIGRRRWAIAEGWLPPDRADKPRPLVSHEAACLLNAGDEDAHVAITLYFADRPPAGPYRVTVAAERTVHLRFNDLRDRQGPAVPPGTDYASVIESDVPIVVQHTRLDGRDGIALISATAYAEE